MAQTAYLNLHDIFYNLLFTNTNKEQSHACVTYGNRRLRFRTITICWILHASKFSEWHLLYLDQLFCQIMKIVSSAITCNYDNRWGYASILIQSCSPSDVVRSVVFWCGGSGMSGSQPLHPRWSRDFFYCFIANNRTKHRMPDLTSSLW